MALVENLSVGILSSGSNTVMPVFPSGISLQIEESIYSLLPKATIQLSDAVGEITEFAMMNKGFNFDVVYKVEDKKIQNSYTVFSNATEVNVKPEGFKPDIKIVGLQSWINSQEIKSLAFKDRLSNVYKAKASSFGFTTDINDTGNNIYWYQNLESDIDFINRTKENCFSMNSGSSPFYAYVTADKVFHLRNGNSLEQGNVKKEFIMRNLNDRSDFYNNINSLQRIDDGSFSYLKEKNKEVFTIDRTTGSLITNSDTMSSHPSPRTGKILVNNVGSEKTDIINNYYSETDIGLQENQKGKVINSHRKTYFIEKYNMRVLLNKENLMLRAGDVVSLKVLSMHKSGTYNNYLSQNFVIERKIDVYNGKEANSFCILTLGRRSASIPTTYTCFPTLL